MSGMNRATLIGNLGKDPEVRSTTGGQRVVTFSLATNETWRDKTSGERKERVEWHTVVIFNEPLGKVAETYLKKGAKCLVEGQIRTRKWQDQSGSDRWTTEIVMGAYQGSLLLLSSPTGRPIEDDERSRDVAPPHERQPSGPIDDDVPF